MAVDFSPETVLIVFDAFALVAAGVGFAAVFRTRPVSVPDARSAFQLLEKSIGLNIPDLAEGYSWGEAVKRLKAMGIDVDWAGVDSSLAGYEAFRYGGKGAPSGGWEQVVRLATKLKRMKA